MRQERPATYPGPKYWSKISSPAFQWQSPRICRGRGSRPEIVPQQVIDRPGARVGHVQEFKPPDRLIEDGEAIGAGESLGRKRAQRRIVGEDIFNPLSGFRDGGAP